MTRDESRPESEGNTPGDGGSPGRDDEAAWADLVASFHASPSEPVGRWPAAEDVEADNDTAGDALADTLDDVRLDPEDEPLDHGSAPYDLAGDTPRTGRVIRPVLGTPYGPGSGRPPSTSPPADDEGHFVPPPPPPIPSGDVVSRLAWAGALGGPLLMLIAVVTGMRVPTWLGALAIFGFVVGFGTLVTRLRGHDPHDPDDGAVV